MYFWKIVLVYFHDELFHDSFLVRSYAQQRES